MLTSEKPLCYFVQLGGYQTQTRLPSSGGPSPPTARPIASIATFSVMRSGIDQPTALREKASVTAARQSRPSLAGMQAMSPAQSLLRPPTVKARSARFSRGSPGSAFLWMRCSRVAPFPASPGFRMTRGARFTLTATPLFRSSRLMRRWP